MSKILMLPMPYHFREENGIRRVVEAYVKHLPKYGYEFVEKTSHDFDVSIGHAGVIDNPDVLICHGLYWTADSASPKWEYAENANVIHAARQALAVTVPSHWVAESFARDMRLYPHVIPHGIDWDLWQGGDGSKTSYVLWNKNRADVDVCNTRDLEKLAGLAPNVRFVSTFGGKNKPDNLEVCGLQPHSRMMELVQRSAVYLSTTKETFGIGILEAMAAGVPVLGWKFGGNVDLVQHGVNGFLAEIGDWDGLRAGLDYCLRYHDQLGENGREMARGYTWERAVEKLHVVIDLAMMPKGHSVTVVIPCYNYGDIVGRALESVSKQTYKPEEVIVVDDGSSPEQAEKIKQVAQKYGALYVRKENGGVATARNLGIKIAETSNVCCLDADDEIAPTFLETCCRELARDRNISIAYTGLRWIMPDGKTDVSQWPGQYSFDLFLERKNQVPTCCVFRREMWERLGGYNQRYAPTGAGAEDAEFFLRAGAYGFGARKVTDEPLFIYHAGSGHTSNREYREVDWLSLHPWTKDKRHPFASLASPTNGFSHPVRQYDEPLISVIIPVGPGHEKKLPDALDSLESQTLRKWEAIVVFDNWDGDVAKIGDLSETLTDLEISYPYMRVVVNKDPSKGAGFARNAGANIARAGLLLFLDADDWLYPDALQHMYDQYNVSGGIVYGDYVAKSFVTEEFVEKTRQRGRLLDYNPRTGEMVAQHYSADFDYDRAMRQPDPNDMYIWNLITSLVPLKYHKEIGGFDETMESWEDWDYWIRMARAGKCFYHVSDNMVVYRFYTGSRRETGLQQYPHLLQYLQQKYEGSEPMPCAGCGGSRNVITPANRSEVVQNQVAAMHDGDYVLAEYRHPNMGQHSVVGPVTQIFYGYRSGGERFYVHLKDMEGRPDLFVPIETIKEAVIQTEVPPAPKSVVMEAHVVPDKAVVKKELHKPDDFTLIRGISEAMARELNMLGVFTFEDLAAMDEKELLTVKGIGKTRADYIFAWLNDRGK